MLAERQFLKAELKVVWLSIFRTKSLEIQSDRLIKLHQDQRRSPLSNWLIFPFVDALDRRSP